MVVQGQDAGIRSGVAETRSPARRLDDLLDQYRSVRRATEALSAPLTPEDCVVQTMQDVSPTKWHLAHTTWFFETLVLAEALPDYQPFRAEFSYLFNSYYNSIGAQFPRLRRGHLTRPTLSEVFEYRAHVDKHMARLLQADAKRAVGLNTLIATGLNHEQQHQELILTDIKHVFSCNPLNPAYCQRPTDRPFEAPVHTWHRYAGGAHEIGHAGDGFAYDCETPRHQVLLGDFEFSSRPVTNAEYLQFMEDGGYERPEHWLSDGWIAVGGQGWRSPLYWERQGGRWWTTSLAGLRPIHPAEPVTHVSYYEADAFARWSGARLPREEEWEVVAQTLPVSGNFLERGRFHPAPLNPAQTGEPPVMVFGDVWEWTASPFTPYPRYQPPQGALGEYNGKFMCNQMVLRGGSCASPQAHLRATYRNFFQPDARWQFTGFRLARDPK